MDFIIRDMLPEDIDGKGTVHYQSWQESYTGIVDSDYLANMSEEKCREMAHRWPENTAVAIVGGKVTGFVCWSASDEIGELNAIYLLNESKGLGIGRALADYAMDRMIGCDKIILWVLKENKTAIGFYEHYGFEKTGESRTLKLGTQIECVCMAKKV